MRRLALIVLFNLAALAAVELGLRAVVDEDRLAPDRATQRARALLADRLYRHDRDLIYSLRPSFHAVYPARALLPGRDGTYEVNTNERGFRTPAFRNEKARGVFRILCMGDSSTFGLQVGDDEAYPQLLGRELARAYPGKFEVINLGVPGYSSRQGIELLRRQGLGFAPDLVTFAFGTNDRFFKRPMNDDEVIRLNQSASGTLLRAVRNLLGRTYTYRFLAASLTPLVAQPRERRAGGGRGRHRVSLSGMRRAIVEAERLLAERGAALVLLDTDFAATDARQALEQAAAELGLDLLDMRALLDAERGES
jgi:hypothetical protein